MPSSFDHPLRNSDIYRNLPTFDPALKGLKALICGGSGISGFHALRALLDTPERWSTVYILSRSALPESMAALLNQAQRKKIEYVSVDLQTGSDDIASKLKKAQVQPDYIFFYSYMNPKSTNSMHPDAAKGIYQLNAPLLDNLLQALPKAAIQPRRILLQTGGKHYGVHIGRARNPLMESDPQPKHLQPDQFYYEQERQLFDFCKKHPETGWNIVRPAAIIGAVSKTWMNAFFPFGVYAAVQAHKGEPLAFGGDFESWQFAFPHSSARMTGYLSEWAVLEDDAANQDFNATDGSLLSWDRFFHELARWYGVEKGVSLPKLDEERVFGKTVTLAGGKDAPLGYGPPTKIPLEFTLADWSRNEENRKAWRKIMAKSEPSGETTTNGAAGSVDFDPFASEEDIANIFVGDFSYLRFGVMGQDKVRSYGFTGYVNTVDAVFEMYEEFAKMGMLPTMKVKEAKQVGVSM